jgi:hypothetical protein
MSTPVTGPLKSSWPRSRDKFVEADGTLTYNAQKYFQDLMAARIQPIQVFLNGSHAAKSTFPATSYPSGSVYQETDRRLWYMAVAGVWTYFAGIVSVNQADLPDDLNAADVDLLAYVADYHHLLRWNGSAWSWAPGENGSGYSVAFVAAPDPLTGWHLCDGSANVLTLKSDGNLAFATVPNTPGTYYRK